MISTWYSWPLALGTLLLLMAGSLLVGVADFTWMAGSEHDQQILFISRLPRTLALVLTGMSLAVAGLLMQMLVRNRFVDPGTTGTLESAMLGLLLVALFAPGLSVFSKMLVAATFAMVGSFAFMGLLRTIPLRSPVMVPLVGIMFGGVIGSITLFLAYRYNLMQTLSNWTNGDFSAVLRGRYELLWLGAGLTVLGYMAANRFTLLGMGRSQAINLGLNYRAILTLGLVIVSLMSAVTIVTAGVIPFLGLIVPNVVSMLLGDNLRRSLPWVAWLGATLVLACDILGRLIRYPYEIPIGTVMGVLGSMLFIYLLLKRTQASHE
ncbi:ABC transporter permease [Marinomonas transparens]|uniref:Iron chelate uptake ABC transporter family permease subunit n=1 Tax=Marinomonas transparens TaxID=2795388 RepID=A0A934JM49_9GAMM|nr:iron chelate uptake ABC transporter family permease subunit [Marinomonas transparens]MBJ7538336.1 iron chelate uptake ABC transporter family permease subunit [Marinomonas transparens]